MMFVTVQEHKLWVAVSNPAVHDAAVTPPAAKPPVLLLHGFPDTHELWEKQVPVLTAAGHQVIAPDLLGFGRSDKPQEVEPYAVAHILGLLTGLLDELGVGQPVVVVGHDWGAVVAWNLAIHCRDRVAGLVALSVGFPDNYFADPRQRPAAWYMMFFCQPEAEQLLQANDWALTQAIMAAEHKAEAQPAATEVASGLAEPGALTAGLNWYRANFSAAWFATTKSTRLQPLLTIPVLGVWSDGDAYCLEPQMRDSGEAAVAPGRWRYEAVAGCGHCIPREAPDTLNKLLTDFLSADLGAGSG